MQGRLWYPPFDDKRASIREIVELFKAGRGYPHAIMNWQSKEQLDMEFILNAPATIIDEHTVEVEGRAVPGQEPGAVHRGADDLPAGAGHRHQGASTTSPR
jgi:dihydrolipoamide dehydrogenase